MLGLAPSPQMAQVDSPSLIGQLLEKEVIKRQIFSIMVINSHKGVLSIGGTAAKAIELAAQQTREELDKLNPLSEIALQDKDARLTKRDKKDKSKLLSGAWDDAFRWSHVEGAEGWWQILMAGIWVNGAKVLKNQPVVLDVCITRPIHQHFHSTYVYLSSLLSLQLLLYSLLLKLTSFKNSLTSLSSSHLLLSPIPSTPAFLAPFHFTPLTKASTPSLASTHPL